MWMTPNIYIHVSTTHFQVIGWMKLLKCFLWGIKTCLYMVSLCLSWGYFGAIQVTLILAHFYFLKWPSFPCYHIPTPSQGHSKLSSIWVRNVKLTLDSCLATNIQWIRKSSHFHLLNISNSILYHYLGQISPMSSPI